MSVVSAQSVTVSFTTRNGTTGVGVNADTLPTGTLVLNGTDNGATVTVTPIATGDYTAGVTLPTLAIHDVLQLRILATVNTVTDKAIIWTDTADILINASGQVVSSSVVGAVGSVTGAVGSVTGAVASVTGNVGGNVVGSVASVTGNVAGTVASVVGAVGSVTAAVTLGANEDTALTRIFTMTNATPEFTTTALSQAPTGGGATPATLWGDLLSNGEFSAAGGIGLLLSTILTKLNTMINGTPAFTTTALANAPGGGGTTPSAVATAVWEDLLAGGDFGTTGSIGALLNANVNAPIGSVPASTLTAFKADTDYATLIADSNGAFVFTPPGALPGTGTVVLKNKANSVTLATITLTFDSVGNVITRSVA